MEPTSSFGYWLRRRRSALDLTQEQLAQQVGCALETIKKIETDTRRPSRQMAERLAECLAIPADERAAFIKAARADLAAHQLAVATQPVAAPASPTPTPAAPPAGTVTFLFTDIAGSTQLWEQYPAAMPVALARHDRLLREAIESHGGLVFKTVGDAFCAAFGTAADALAAALAIQRAMYAEDWIESGLPQGGHPRGVPLQVWMAEEGDATGAGLPQGGHPRGVPLQVRMAEEGDATGAGLPQGGHPRGVPLQVRIALHTGAVEARDGDYFGPPLN